MTAKSYRAEEQFDQLVALVSALGGLTEIQSQSLVAPKAAHEFVARLYEYGVDDKKVAQALSQIFHCELFNGQVIDSVNIIRSSNDPCPWIIVDEVLYVTNPYDRGQIEPLMRRNKSAEDKVSYTSLGIIALSDFDTGLIANLFQAQHNHLPEYKSGVLVDQLIDDIITEAVNKNATDVHIIPDFHGCSVKFRIDGRCEACYASRFQNIPADKINLIANNLMERVSKQNNYLEPASGFMSFQVGHKNISIRLEMAPVKVGTVFLPKFTLRLLNIKRNTTKLEHFVLPQHQLSILKNLTLRPDGLIIVTGPTGSGKSTMLKAMLRNIRETYPEKNIYSIEDPVEEQLDGVVSVEVNKHVSFSQALRSILRHDPDVIMVGEIRDQETAELAMRAALTGHLVLTTLHANDAHGAIGRLRNFGLDNGLIADNLLAITAQRLVNSLCKECSRWISLDDLNSSQAIQSITHLIHQYAIQLPHVQTQQVIKIPVGCNACLKGLSGRVVVQEIFQQTLLSRQAIAEGKTSNEIRSMQLSNQTFQPIWSHGAYLLSQGRTNITELEKKLGPCTINNSNRGNNSNAGLNNNRVEPTHKKSTRLGEVGL